MVSLFFYVILFVAFRHVFFFFFFFFFTFFQFAVEYTNSSLVSGVNVSSPRL